MVKYTSTKQLSFTEFQTPFVNGLDGTNRRVLLARQIPWYESETSTTSESWIVIIFFVMNLALWGQINFFVQFLGRF